MNLVAWIIVSLYKYWQDQLQQCCRNVNQKSMQSINSKYTSQDCKSSWCLMIRCHKHWLGFIRMRQFPCMLVSFVSPLTWRHIGRYSVSNHQPQHSLLNRLFRRRSKKTSKLRVTGLCVGNSPATGEFPSQMAKNAENLFIWWRHHVTLCYRITTAIFTELYIRVFFGNKIRLFFSL